MQKQMLNKPVLFLLYGFPGSGKTFFARQFSDEVKAVHLSAEQLRSEFFEDPVYDQNENGIVEHLVSYLVQQFLQAGVSVLLDYDADRQKQRAIFKELAISSKAELLLVWFQLDIETAFSRVARRDRRRPDDKHARQLDRTSFESKIRQMQNPVHGEDYVVVSGKHTFITQRNSVFKKLYERNLIDLENKHSKLAKPELVNLIPNPAAGRVDPSRRNIIIR